MGLFKQIGLGLAIFVNGACIAGAGWTADYALILTNRNYDAAPTATGAANFRDYEDALRASGFVVLGDDNWTGRTMRREALRLQDAILQGDAERVIVVLSGHFANDGRDTWLLGRDAAQPSAIGVGEVGLSLNALGDVLTQRGGQAVLMLGSGGVRLPLGTGLREGMRRFEAPQGVTVLRGPADDMLRPLVSGILQSGFSYADVVKRLPGSVTMDGFLPQGLGFSGASGAPVTAAPPVSREVVFFRLARDLRSIEALETYLKQYPDGQFAVDAQRLIDDLRDAPRRDAQAGEEALRLGADRRRDVQRDLTLLGFDTRGVDGVFGPGTRRAIAGFQQKNGFPETGFLTRDQLAVLDRMGAARAAELEEEARARRVEQERQDRAFWQQSGQGRDESSLRAYLRRYPDGLFSEEAQQRLDRIEADRRAGSAQERNDWVTARSRNTVSAYRDYLRRYPRGQWAEAAEDRIKSLQAEAGDTPEAQRDKGEEAQVAGSRVSRLLVETRLGQIGLNTGQVDGVFDAQTRRALRQFQQAMNLPVTGFVSQSTMVRLLAARPLKVDR